MSGAFRCSALSATLAEPLAGTASTIRGFLLLEDPGPWGVDALRSSRLPTGVGAELERRGDAVGVRPLLIRRHGRSRPAPLRCFAAYADPRQPWLEAGLLRRAEDVLDVDLDALAAGSSVGMEPHPGPLFLVCTHGRHDVCCAEQGRPLVAALGAAYPEQTWECSHIGGDRFAGNLVVLPDGLYYGRVDPAAGPRIAAEHLSGRLDLDHLRGRSGFGFATQAAEWHLRRRLGMTGQRQVCLLQQSRTGAVTEAVFEVHGGRRWRVRVGAGRGAPQPLTCRSHPSPPLRLRLLDIESLPADARA